MDVFKPTAWTCLWLFLLPVRTVTSAEPDIHLHHGHLAPFMCMCSYWQCVLQTLHSAVPALCCPCTRCPLDRGPLPCCDRGQRWNVRQQKHRPWLIVKAARLDLSNDWQGYFRVLLVVFYCLLFIYKQSLALDIPTWLIHNLYPVVLVERGKILLWIIYLRSVTCFPSNTTF